VDKDVRGYYENDDLYGRNLDGSDRSPQTIKAQDYNPTQTFHPTSLASMEVGRNKMVSTGRWSAYL
jgi:hypothetical protein